MSGILYVVATPIGNLKDISQRLRETLEAVAVILAEDTRVTLRLLNHLGIKKRLFSYTDHASEQQEDKIISELESGVSFALVTDAGTPGISDPGHLLVERVLAAGLGVIPVSGPSAVATLVSVFGKPHTAHHFWGFFPTKTKKQKELVASIDLLSGIHVFFESPFRILKTLEKYFLDKEHYHLVIGREMTKLYETFYRGTPQAVYEQLKAGVVKGEFCVGVMAQGSRPKA
ncbi:MAG TPA: 16S rRNA (cytidine(1402)-2'-O)-methyltransferase [bacterium]|nr:16S rRNA (cytidine(1402)-2'-O)-methyltransferase [bacterium]